MLAERLSSGRGRTFETSRKGSAIAERQQEQVSSGSGGTKGGRPTLWTLSGSDLPGLARAWPVWVAWGSEPAARPSSRRHATPAVKGGSQAEHRRQSAPHGRSGVGDRSASSSREP